MKPLSDYIALAYGKSLPGRYRKDGTVPVYGSAGVVGVHDQALRQGPGVIVGRKGSVGAIHWSHTEFFPIDTTFYVIPKTGMCLRYIYYLLKTLPLPNMNTDVAVPGLNRENALSLKVHIPSVGEQRRIAEVLSAYDRLIETNRRRIALLEHAARELYQEWFFRLRFPGHEEAVLVDGLPGGWERVRLNDIVSTQYGYTESANEEPIGPKFLRGTDINKTSYIDWDAVPFCPIGDIDLQKYLLRPGDLLVVRMADPGKVAIVEKQIHAVFASYLVRLAIRDRSMTLPLYLFYALTDVAYQGFIRAASGGSTRKSASAKLLTDFGVVQPPIEIQRLFVDLIAPLRKMIGTLLDQNAQASASRDVLLPRLISGEVAV